MATLVSIFVRVPANAKLEAFVELTLGQLQGGKVHPAVHPSEPWLALYYDAPGLSVGRAAEGISRGLSTEVVYVVIQTTASVFWLSRFVNGVAKREVTTTDGVPWEATGEPESWESLLFPEPEYVDEYLEELFESDSTPAYQERLRKVFTARRVLAGEFEPYVQDPFLVVATALGMTSSSFELFFQQPAFTRSAGAVRKWGWGFTILGVLVLLMAAGMARELIRKLFGV